MNTDVASCDVLTIDQVAHECGVHRSTVTRWLREGKLTRYTNAADRRSVCVLRSEVEAIKHPPIVTLIRPGIAYT